MAGRRQALPGRQLGLDPGEAEQAGGRIRRELDQQVDVAVGPRRALGPPSRTATAGGCHGAGRVLPGRRDRGTGRAWRCLGGWGWGSVHGGGWRGQRGRAVTRCRAAARSLRIGARIGVLRVDGDLRRDVVAGAFGNRSNRLQEFAGHEAEGLRGIAPITLQAPAMGIVQVPSETRCASPLTPESASRSRPTPCAWPTDRSRPHPSPC